MHIRRNSDVLVLEDCNVEGWIVWRIMWELFQIYRWNVSENTDFVYWRAS